MIPLGIVAFSFLFYGIYLLFTEKSHEEDDDQVEEVEEVEEAEEAEAEEAEKAEEAEDQDEPKHFDSRIDDDVERMLRNMVDSAQSFWDESVQPGLNSLYDAFDQFMKNYNVEDAAEENVEEERDSDAEETEEETEEKTKEETEEKTEEEKTEETEDDESSEGPVDLWSSYRLDKKYEEMKSKRPLEEYLSCEERRKIIRRLFRKIYNSPEYKKDPLKYIEEQRSKRSANEYSVVKDTVLNLLEHTHLIDSREEPKEKSE